MVPKPSFGELPRGALTAGLERSVAFLVTPISTRLIAGKAGRVLREMRVILNKIQKFVGIPEGCSRKWKSLSMHYYLLKCKPLEPLRSN